MGGITGGEGVGVCGRRARRREEEVKKGQRKWHW